MTHVPARRLPLLFTLGLVGACSAAPGPAEPAEITSSVSSNITGGTTLVVGPAEVWTGVANAADVGLRLDIRAEALLDGTVVASGELGDVAASRSAQRQEGDPEVADQAGDLTGFKSAILRTVELARPTTGAADGAILDFRLSVRRACPKHCGVHAHGPDAGTVRVWFNGAATDHGAHRDAGSRFFTKVDGVKTNQYLRGEGPLAFRQAAAQGHDPVHQGALVAEQFLHFLRGIVLRFAISFAELVAPIERHGQLRLVGLVVLRHSHRVGAGQDARPSGAGAGDLCGRRHARRFLMHAPRDAI